MKALLQRVNNAAVTVDGETVGKIGPGLVVFIGVANSDGQEDIEYLVNKIPQLRIFDDADGKFNLSAQDVNGELLPASSVNWLTSSSKGRRPGFTDAAPPDIAEKLFNRFVAQIRLTGLQVATGRFQTHMHVSIENDGTVTIFIDSRERLTSRSA